MKILVVGSAAGGGFPQWNCNCENCKGLRESRMQAKARTQSSIAVSENGEDWILFNASPDIRQQILMHAPLQPKKGIRDTGIKAVVLVDSQIDHTTGLLLLREHGELTIYGTEQTHTDLTVHHPILKTLEHYCKLHYHTIQLNQESFKIPGFDSIELLPVPLQSEAPPYSPNRGKHVLGSNIGFMITSLKSQKKVFYAPGLGDMTESLKDTMKQADILLVDGTFWDEEEMIHKKIANKKASKLGHLPQSGQNGMIALLDPMKAERKILIHINNTNPILNENSEERKQLEEKGIEVSYDGMMLTV